MQACHPLSACCSCLSLHAAPCSLLHLPCFRLHATPPCFPLLATSALLLLHASLGAAASSLLQPCSQSPVVDATSGRAAGSRMAAGRYASHPLLHHSQQCTAVHRTVHLHLSWCYRLPGTWLPPLLAAASLPAPGMPCMTPATKHRSWSMPPCARGITGTSCACCTERTPRCLRSGRPRPNPPPAPADESPSPSPYSPSPPYDSPSPSYDSPPPPYSPSPSDPPPPEYSPPPPEYSPPPPYYPPPPPPCAEAGARALGALGPVLGCGAGWPVD